MAPSFKKPKRKGPKAAAKQPVVAPEDDIAWALDVDVNAPLEAEVLHRVYGAFMPCPFSVQKHKGSDCRENPACIVGLRKQKATAAAVEEACSRALGEGPEPLDTSAAPLRRGLRNLANTCYLNTIVQLLFHNDALRDAVLSATSEQMSKKKKSSQLVDCSIGLLFAKLLVQQSKAVDPTVFVKALEIDPRFQQDAEEFYNLLNQMLQDSDPSIRKVFQREFGGNVLYEKTCGKCGAVSKKTDPITHLSVPPAASIEEAIRSTQQDDVVEGYICESCGAASDAVATTRLKQPPQTLVVQVNRFRMTGDGGREKVNTDIAFQHELDLAAQVPGLEGDMTYKLCATVNHLGAGANSGHYVLHHLLPDGNWYSFDDSTVSKIRKYDGKGSKSKDVYMLVYRRADLEPAEELMQPPPSLMEAVDSETARLVERVEEYAGRKTVLSESLKAWGKAADIVFATRHTLPKPLYAVPREWLKEFGRAQTCLTETSFPIADADEQAESDGDDDVEIIPQNDLCDVAKLMPGMMCEHNKLHPRKPFKWLTEEAFVEIRENFNIPAVSTTDSLCEVCAKNRVKTLKVNIQREQEDAKMRQLAAVESTKGALVSKPVLESWLSQQPFDPNDCDLSKGLSCPHGGLSVTASRSSITEEVLAYLTSDRGFQYTNEFPTDTKVCEICVDENTAKTSHLHTRKMRKMEEKAKLPALSQADGNRARYKNRDFAKQYKKHLKAWTAKQEEQKKAREEAKKAAEAAAVEAKKLRGTKAKPVEVADSDSEDEKCPDIRTDYPMVNAGWGEQFRAWLNDADSEERPKAAPSNENILCEHNLLPFSVEELHPDQHKGSYAPLAILTEKEYEDLEALYGKVSGPSLKFVELNEQRVLEPATCEACAEKRRNMEDEAKRNFVGGSITLKGKLRLSKKNSQSVEFVLSPLDASTPLDKVRVMVVEHFLVTEQAFVDKDTIIFETGGRGSDPLPIPDGTLLENGVVDGGTIKFQEVWAQQDGKGNAVKHFTDPTASVVESAPAAASPVAEQEVNFRNSRLYGRSSELDSSPQASQEIACGVCTFLNAPTNKRCEMCDSPL